MSKNLSFLGVLLLASSLSFGHAWTVKRSWCGGIFHKKFQAYAQVSSYYLKRYKNGIDATGKSVGYNSIIHWYSVCDQSDKGCSRPRVAECNSSGYSYDYLYDGAYLVSSSFDNYYGHAKASYQTNGISLIQDNNARGAAGFTGDYIVDNDLYARLKNSGASHTDINGDIDITDDNRLVLSNVSGNISITNTSNRYSSFQVLVIKERDDMTEDESQAEEDRIAQGIFDNVVYSGEITITKDQINQTGIFRNLNPYQLSSIRDNVNYGISLNNVSLEQDLSNVPLEPNEHLTVVSMVDGGFDMTSAVVPDAPMSRTVATQSSSGNELLQFYPNPATQSVSCNVYSDLDNNNISITVCDLLSRQLGKIYSGYLHKGLNTINDINVSKLPKGTQIFQIKTEDKVISSKVVIN